MSTELSNEVIFKETRQAFEDAIAAGFLSEITAHTNYAGHYMYMGSRKGIDLFKNCVTRKYLEVKYEPS